jgi:twitching motility two-component system response regulator PilH
LARKILLADDSVTAQNMGRKILADAGYEVITVNNGSAALKKIAESRPDLIVLDVYMPGYSGLEVCQRLKETGDTSRIPILLTVGKLEPFKPEEAKRARADAFIIKPFEASELLSALTKLEDKMVPSGESSKPGRFARAIAAVEEGRYDKSVSAEEDNGWKSRIAFPSKKKAKPEADSDESEIYNPVNKDLRTVVDRAPAPKPAEPEQRVDLGAVAPEGLPKDVTPEEIAALAAAAAQIQGKTADAQSAEPAQETAQSDTLREITEQAKPTSDSAVGVTAAPSAEPVAEQKPEESETKSDQPAELEVVRQMPDLAAVTPADVMAAIDSLEKTGLSTASEAASAEAPKAKQPISSESATQDESEPITMAVAAGAESAFVQTRWSAVPVTLAPEEAAVILEEEMRRAFAAAEIQPAPALPAETQSTAIQPAPEVTTSIDIVKPVSTPSAGDELQAISTVVNSATEAFRAPIKEFETVAAPAIESTTTQPADIEPTPLSSSESAPSAPVSREPVEAQSEIEAKAEEVSVARASENQEASVPWFAHKESPPTEPSQLIEQPKVEPEKAEQLESAAISADVPEAISTERSEAMEPVVAQTAQVESAPVSRTAEELEQAAERAVAGPRKFTNESEIAATTAAAWASWRRVRESSDSPSGQSRDRADDRSSSGPGEAAMAVAAGAEKAPEEGEAPEIANIVDSVLADLRPKIVEEISKKLKKKS